MFEEDTWYGIQDHEPYDSDPYEDVIKFEKLRGRKRGNERGGGKSKRPYSYKRARREAERAKDEVGPDPE